MAGSTGARADHRRCPPDGTQSSQRLAGARAAAVLMVCAVFAVAVRAQVATVPPDVSTVQPVRVGLIGPFSGPSAAFGLPMQNGVRMAVDEINAAGGYLGRPIELVMRDDAARQDVGNLRSQELVAENVVATIGFCNTGVALASLDVFQQAKVPLIIPCATGSGLTARYSAPDSYIFRNAAPDAMQVQFLVAELLKRGWTRVAVFADTSAYGAAGLADIEAALDRQRLEPVYVARFAVGVRDLYAELKAAREAGAQVVFSHTVGPENAVIARGRDELKWNVPQVGPWPLSFPFFIQGAGPAAEGALVAQTFIAEPVHERRASFLAAYARRFGGGRMTVPMVAAQGYDAAYLLLQGLFGVRSGQLSGPAIKASLENLPRAHVGMVTTYDKPFGLQHKEALTVDRLVLGRVTQGGVTFANPEDARRYASLVRNRQVPLPPTEAAR